MKARALRLHREELTELGTEELQAVAGGLTIHLTGTETYTCPTFDNCKVPKYTNFYPCTGTGQI